MGDLGLLLGDLGLLLGELGLLLVNSGVNQTSLVVSGRVKFLGLTFTDKVE